MTTAQAAITVVIIAAVTLLTRALPFFIFPSHERTPAVILYLGKVLPYAIIGMLIVYCLKDVRIAPWPHGLPELLGVAAVAGLYLYRRNTLLAIGGGTAIYMLLLRLVFAQ